MPGEGERQGEGRENPEKDPFEGYAEELERKQRESEGADELDKDPPDSVVTPTQKPAESLEAEIDVNQDEFEAYARELKKKYAEEEGGTDSSQVGKNESEEDDETSSADRLTSPAPSGDAARDPKSESVDPSAQQASDRAPGEPLRDHVDTGSNLAEPHAGPNTSTDHPIAPRDSNVQNDSQQDRTRSEDTELTSSRLLETAPKKQQDSAGTNEQKPDNHKQESVSLNPQQATDSAGGDSPPKSSDLGGYQQNPASVSRDLHNVPSRSEHTTNSPNDTRDSEKGKLKPVGPDGFQLAIGMEAASADEKAPKESEPIKEKVPTDEPSGKVNSKGYESVPLEVDLAATKQLKPSDKTISSSESSAESKGVLFTSHEWKVGESNYLRIPHRYLTSFEKDDILEARVVRESDPGKEQRLYTRVGFAEPHLNIYHLRPSRRETFHILALDKYEFSDFARDFNKCRPKEFRNVKLSCSDGKVMMKVDGNVVELKRPRLISDGGGVVLEGALLEKENGSKIRIVRHSEKLDLHLSDYPTNHPRILYMKAIGNRIEIGHRSSQHEPDHRTRLIPSRCLEPRSDKDETRIAKNRLLKLDGSSMTKKEIRAWIDTEGCLYVPKPGAISSPRLQCSQKHREPLEAYVRGVEELTGVVAKIRQDKRGMYIAEINDIEGIAKVIGAVGPFRAPQRIDQVRRLMKHLTREREGAGRRRVVERARRILGL